MPQSGQTPDTTALRFSLALEPSHMLRARERLRDYLRLHCADQELVDDVVLCLEEACTNAIRHSDADEEMRVELRFEGEELIGLVSDRGKGFDVEAFDPRAVPDPLGIGGRGLYIISQIMDEMSLRLDGGLEVRMLKRGVPRCEPAPLESGLGDLGVAGASDYRDARLRTMLEEIDEAFVALDWDYRYIHANAAALSMSGKSLGELLGRRPWDLWPEYEDSPAGRAFREAIELGRPSTIEQQSAVGGDWQETRVYPTSTGLSAYVRVINERKQAEEALKRQAEMIQLSFDAIFVWRLEGAIESWNRGAEELYGFSEAEALGRVSQDLLATAYPIPLARIEATLRERGSWEGEISHRTKDGREVIVSTRHQLMTGDEGVERVLETNRDITQHKRLEGERERLIEDLREDVEVALGEGLAPDPHPRRAQTLWLVLPAVALAITVLAVLRIEAASYPPRLFSALNITFLSAISFLIALVAARSYLVTRGRAVLFLGCGTLAIGLGALLVPLGAAGASVDAIVAVYDFAVLLAAACHFIGSLSRFAFPGQGNRGRPWGWLCVTYGSVAAAIGVQTLLVRSGHWPASFIEGAGVTPFDRAVLYCAIALFGLSAVMLRLGVPSTTSRFRRWYSLGLGLIALGLVAVSLQLKIGDPLNWVGRASQYLGAVFMLAAVVSTVRERGAWLLPLERAFRESEARYRRLIEVSPDAIVVEAGGEVVFANPAAADLVGATAPESLVGAAFRALFRTSDQERAAELVEEARAGDGIAVAEIMLQRLRGEPIEVEVRAAQVEFGGHRAAQLIMRDISDRRRIENEQQQRLAQLQHIATTLQENFIRPLPDVPGVEFGVVSQAAYEPELVGGDFSDVFEVAGGRVAVLIGDVAGKGIKAAGLTETVRSTVRAFAAIDASPAFVIGKTNEVLLRGEGDGPLVTAFLLMLDPKTGHALYTSAGHPAAIHVGSLSCHALKVVHEPPLRTVPHTYHVDHVTISLDDYLLLYTDGLTEARRGEEEFGERRLVDAAASLRGGSAQDVAEGVRDAALAFAGSLRDDLMVVCLSLA